MPSAPVVAKYLALFSELYPTREVSELTAEAWMIALPDLGDPAFAWAADRLLQSSGRTFFPTPNELRSYLGYTPGRSVTASTAGPGARLVGGVYPAALGVQDDPVTTAYRARAVANGSCTTCGGRRGIHAPDCRVADTVADTVVVA